MELVLSTRRITRRKWFSIKKQIKLDLVVKDHLEGVFPSFLELSVATFRSLCCQ